MKVNLQKNCKVMKILVKRSYENFYNPHLVMGGQLGENIWGAENGPSIVQLKLQYGPII